MRLVLFLCAAAIAFSQSWNYEPITAESRFKWTIEQTLGPANLTGDIALAGYETVYNIPRPYGTHWTGFEKRIWVPLTINSVSNTMEASVGSLWGEDPRYFRTEGKPFFARVGNVIKMTFLAGNRDGHVRLALARYVAITGSNFLADEWVPDGQATTHHATIRIGLSFAGRMGSNAFTEFWPDFKKDVLRIGH